MHPEIKERKEYCFDTDYIMSIIKKDAKTIKASPPTAIT